MTSQRREPECHCVKSGTLPLSDLERPLQRSECSLPVISCSAEPQTLQKCCEWQERVSSEMYWETRTALMSNIVLTSSALTSAFFIRISIQQDSLSMSKQANGSGPFSHYIWLSAQQGAQQGTTSRFKTGSGDKRKLSSARADTPAQWAGDGMSHTLSVATCACILTCFSHWTSIESVCAVCQPTVLCQHSDQHFFPADRDLTSVTTLWIYGVNPIQVGFAAEPAGLICDLLACKLFWELA